MVFVADGRFHLEVRAGGAARRHSGCLMCTVRPQSAMIANPSVKAYRYNPYDKQMTIEQYDHATMLTTREYAALGGPLFSGFGVDHHRLVQKGSQARDQCDAVWYHPWNAWTARQPGDLEAA